MVMFPTGVRIQARFSLLSSKLCASRHTVINPLWVQVSLQAAVKSAADFLNQADKVVLVVGSQIKRGKAIKQTLDLANACNYPVAVMPRSKGLFPESHPK